MGTHTKEDDWLGDLLHGRAHGGALLCELGFP
jgi:hypothetical protein